MSQVNNYITERMNYFRSIDCEDTNCETCEKNCDGYEELLDKISNEVQEKFNVQCKSIETGKYTSCGYDMFCYAISFIDEEGKLGLLAFTEECY